MLVDFGQADGREVERLLENRVRSREFHEVCLRKDLFHFPPDEFVQSVIVVDVQETASAQIGSQVLDFSRAENYIPMPRKMYKRVIEQIRAANLHRGRRGIQTHSGLFVGKGDEVWQRCRVGVPVPATTVFEQPDSRLLGLDFLGRTRSE